ncbi:MAG: NAD-dependent deacylase [Alphaproteobacteria bacterium]|nr:MAG: NAD-dependent deacylase [Alphaproteobacteria bacterium]
MAKYAHIVVLTGAGISAESGLSTFRDEGGLWARHRIEDVATPEAFLRNPELVQNFYNARRAQLKTVEPNAAHRALARLEAEYPGRVTVITQNVDDLHERAGSRRVIHMHGELKKARCLSCDVASPWEDDILPESACPACGATGRLRPHVVWFGEIPLHLDEIDRELGSCDLFVSIGTSGAVYPAAGFVTQVRALGRAHTVELNLEPSAGSHFFHEARHGPATRVVPAFVSELLSESGG